MRSDERDHKVAVYDGLLAALKETVCWFGAGMTAEQAGAKCETANDAREMALAAIAAALAGRR
jgi:hypothetical protein